MLRLQGGRLFSVIIAAETGFETAAARSALAFWDPSKTDGACDSWLTQHRVKMQILKAVFKLRIVVLRLLWTLRCKLRKIFVVAGRNGRERTQNLLYKLF